jgi:peptidoglycan/xylan/chitin deacetylase (PgdA/CDA1 family)/glycosyltransferase involved in cell wall biosynthesis
MKPQAFSNTAPLRFSVIIPTYQRRDVVLNTVRALVRQEFAGTFEVIVVVDGSKDGSAEALQGMETPFPFIILEQSNQGAATARNQGAAKASGEILLFLDDDMEAHPRLLVEHDRSHQKGADVVLGHIPLHPKSPSNFLSAEVKCWTDKRVRRLSSPEAKLTLHDLLTGQISMTQQVFYSIGGFDTTFTHGGTFGNEDVDFGYRLLLKGYQIIFNPDAISWQYYVVSPRQHLRQWYQTGHADVLFARKHPNQTQTIFALNKSEKWINRYLWRPLLKIPVLAPLLTSLLRWLTLTLVEKGAQDIITTTLFFEAKSVEYWRGVQEAGGIPEPRPLRILAYHTIADLAGDPVLEPYGVPPDQFRRQLDVLEQAGYRFVNADEALTFLQGRGGLPRQALLLTFDDCYEDLLTVALPILEERAIPAVAFAVSGCLGGINEWDSSLGATQLRLLNGGELRKLAERGVEIGAHSRTHRQLTRLSTDELIGEVAGSASDLESFGLDRPRFFAYPYGEYNQRVQQVVQESGLQAAFTVDSNLVRPGQNPYQIPRVEITREDRGWKLLWKVASVGHPVFSFCYHFFGNGSTGRDMVN